MAEEKEEKRKPGIVRRIIKWIGLGLLTLLIISGLVFQAPWKAITLLLIIMSACTVLPKPVRKWFWLSVGVVIIALVIWVFLPEDTEGWRPYTFDEELAAMEARRAVPDEENAAIIYNQLLEDYNEAAFEPNFLDPNLEGLTRKEPWSSKDYPEAAQWLKQHGNTIAKLVEASKIEKCRFPIAANPIDLSETTDRFGPMRRWAQLLIRAGNNDLGEGRPDEAIEKFSCALQMAKHFYQQPMMIDLLVGISVEALATSQFNTFIITENPTEEHLSIIEKALAEIKHNWAADLSKILDTEKLLNKNLLAMFYEINDMGKLRFRRNLQSLFPTELEITFGYWWKKLVKASHILWWFYMPSTPQKAGEIIDAGWQRLYAKAEPDYDWQKSPTEFKFSLTTAKLNYRYVIEACTSISEGSFYGIHDHYLRGMASQRGGLLIVALRRYKNKTGHWPESLDDIKALAPAEVFIDPTSGGVFVYKPAEENFTLYSKGKNNIDEDGKRDGWGEEKTEADDWLIWPRKSCKAEKESTDAEQQ